jgi:hypothetical protein
MPDFKTCKIDVGIDGYFRCSILNKDVLLCVYALTDIEAFDKMCDLLNDIKD